MKSLLSLFVILLYQQSYACNCSSWAGNFFEACNKSSLIVKVDILRYSANFSLVARVTKVYKGKIGQKIKVYGNNGINCRANLEKFTLGESYIFALFHSQSQYFLNNCGDYYLHVKKDSVSSLQTTTAFANEAEFRAKYGDYMIFRYGIAAISMDKFEAKIAKVLH